MKRLTVLLATIVVLAACGDGDSVSRDPRPPQAQLVTSGGEQTGGIGGFTWSNLHADFPAGVPIPKKPVVARAGEHITFRLAFSPTYVVVTAWTFSDGKTEELRALGSGFSFWSHTDPRSPSEPILKREPTPFQDLELAPGLPPGRYVISVFADAGRNAASYGFFLEIVE